MRIADRLPPHDDTDIRNPRLSAWIVSAVAAPQVDADVGILP